MIMDDYGNAINRLIEFKDADASQRHVCYTNLLQQLDEKKLKHIAIYAHSGVETEQACIERASILGPYFIQNGIYPIFVSSRSGFMETLPQILTGTPQIASMFGAGLNDALSDVQTELINGSVPHTESRDLRMELICRRLVRPMWTQFRQNAIVSSRSGGMLHRAVSLLKKALAERKGSKRPKVHLIGHSAGCILQTLMLSRLAAKPKVDIASCTMLAPACSVSFATRYIGAAIKAKSLQQSQLHINILSEANELNDNVAGLYGRSLLYLVSRALDDRWMMPILGLEETWATELSDLDGLFGETGRREVVKWRETLKRCKPNIWSNPEMKVASSGEDTPSAHRMFDNDVDIMTAVMRRVSGKSRLKHPIESLQGFQ